MLILKLNMTNSDQFQNQDPSIPKDRIQPSDIPVWANAFSGALGGAVANLMVFPLSLVATRLQVQEKLLKAQEAKQTKLHQKQLEKLRNIDPNDPEQKKLDAFKASLSDEEKARLVPENLTLNDSRLYRGMIDAAIRIYNEEGLIAFYDGAIQDTLSTMLSAFFYFYAYDILRNARLKQVARNKASGKPPSTLGIAEELLIGSLAGIFCKFFTAPLNNIVTRQQTAALVAQSRNLENNEAIVPKAAQDAPSAQPSGENKQPASATVRVGGTIPLGTHPTGNNGLSHNSLSKKLHNTNQHHHIGVNATTIAKEIYSERGILGFWSGFGATVLLSVNPSLTYYFFQTIKVLFIRGGKGATPEARKADRARRRENPTKWQLFLFSASAKTLASLITYPLSLVKSQMQVKGSCDDSSNNDTKTGQKQAVHKPGKSMVATFSEIVKTNGVGHLYQGARAQILKGFFSQGITMLTKDQIARFIIYLYFFSLSRIRKGKVLV